MAGESGFATFAAVAVLAALLVARAEVWRTDNTLHDRVPSGTRRLNELGAVVTSCC